MSVFVIRRVCWALGNVMFLKSVWEGLQPLFPHYFFCPLFFKLDNVCLSSLSSFDFFCHLKAAPELTRSFYFGYYTSHLWISIWLFFVASVSVFEIWLIVTSTFSFSSLNIVLKDSLNRFVITALKPFYHSSWKHQIRYLTVSVGPVRGMAWLDSLLRGSQGCSRGVHHLWSHLGFRVLQAPWLWVEFSSLGPQGWGPQLLKATFCSLPCGPLHSMTVGFFKASGKVPVADP